MFVLLVAITSSMCYNNSHNVMWNGLAQGGVLYV